MFSPWEKYKILVVAGVCFEMLSPYKRFFLVVGAGKPFCVENFPKKKFGKEMNFVYDEKSEFFKFLKNADGNILLQIAHTLILIMSKSAPQLLKV